MSGNDGQVDPRAGALAPAGGAADMCLRLTGLPEGPQGWYAPAAYRAAFGGAGRAGRKARLRWIRELAPWQKYRVGGAGARAAWLVRGDARLISDLTVAEYAQQTRTLPIPAEVKAGPEKTARKHVAGLELLRRERALQSARPDLAVTGRAYFAELERLNGNWARAHGLSCHRGAMLKLRKRLNAGECIDGRLRSGRKPKPIDERLAERVRDLYLHQNRFGIADGFEGQAELAAELGIAPLSRHQVRKIVSDLPLAAKVLAREKPRIFEATCVPKIRTDMTGLPAGSWWCLDGREVDVQVRVPDSKGGWRAVRPVVTGIVDARARKFLAVDVRGSENAVGILCGIKRALDFGAPDDVTKDNGWAYRKAGGMAGRGGWKRARVDDARIGNVFAELGTRVHTSLPYRAWAKIIESQWRWCKKLCDRWHVSFWGGSPAERSHDAEQLVKRHVEELPTLDQFRENLLLAVETINATPRRVLGGLSPNLMFERFRGPIRRVDPAVVDLIACPLDAYADGRPKPHRVGRDGVDFKGIPYELDAQELMRLQGRDVFIRAELDRVGSIRLCDERGRPLAVATQQKLIRAGCTDEDFRAAMQKKAHVRRAAKAYLPERDILLETTTGRILRARRDRALADEAELRKEQPVRAAPDVAIVRPDLVEAAKTVARKHAARSARSRFEPGSETPQSGFERLALWARMEARTECADASAEPTIGQRFARLNTEPDVAEPEAAKPRRAWGAAG